MFNNIDKAVVYLLEGLAIAVCVFLTTKKSLSVSEIGMLSLTITAVIIILDTFSREVLRGARQGMGLGIGVGQVLAGGAAEAVGGLNLSVPQVPELVRNAQAHLAQAVMSQPEPYIKQNEGTVL